MAYSLPDKTGTDPRYKVVNDMYNINDKNQKLIFDPSNGPIFKDSLEIYKIDASVTKRNAPARLQEGTDYYIQTDDIDYTTESKIYVMNDIKKRIIKSVSFKLNCDVPVTVSLNYQLVYCANPNSDPNSVGGVVDLTPDTIIELFREISNLKLQYQSYLTNAALPQNMDAPKLLRYDINKENDNNIITDEVYNVNTFIRHNAIFPKYGAFFKDSVVVKDSNGNTLQLGKDYLIQMDNLGFTKLTSNKSGVCDCILIIRDCTGEVKVTYHAVGGKVVVQDISSMYSHIVNIREYLANNKFVTSEGLNQTDVIKLHAQRIEGLEEEMRKLVNGTPTYSDVTSGKVAIHPINSDVSGLRWFTLATMNTVIGGTEPAKMGRFKCNIEIPELGYQADVIVGANIFPLIPNSPTISIKVLNSVDPADDTIWSDQATTLNRTAPILFRGLTDPNAGAIFQIGVTNAANARIAVEDTSGTESCWKLVLSDNTNNLPNENIGNGWGDNDIVVANNIHGNTPLNINMNDIYRCIEVISPHRKIVWLGNNLIKQFNNTPIFSNDIHYKSRFINRIDVRTSVRDTSYDLTTPIFLSDTQENQYSTGYCHINNNRGDVTVDAKFTNKRINSGDLFFLNSVITNNDLMDYVSLRRITLICGY